MCYECLATVDLENETLTIRLGSEVRGVLVKVRGGLSLNMLKTLSTVRGVRDITINLHEIGSVRKYQVDSERADLKEYFKARIEGNLSFVELTYGGEEIRILMNDNDAVRFEKLINRLRVKG
ncbi:MAG: hypothetical protein QXK83_07700 [Zestosphaera sp.]